MFTSVSYLVHFFVTQIYFLRKIDDFLVDMLIIAYMYKMLGQYKTQVRHGLMTTLEYYA